MASGKTAYDNYELKWNDPSLTFAFVRAPDQCLGIHGHMTVPPKRRVKRTNMYDYVERTKVEKTLSNLRTYVVPISPTIR